MTRGFLITFEGIDGSGKSTQIQLLHAFLERDKKPCLLTREPGGTEGAEALRRLLKDPRYTWSPLSQFFLLMAARHDHVIQTILPALSSGMWVLCDRFTDSTHVYQGHFLERVPCQILHHVCNDAAENITPDLTFILDMDPVQAHHRIQQRIPYTEHADSYDHLALKDKVSLRDRFLACAQRDPQRYHVIFADLPEEEVHRAIVQKFQEWYEGLKP